ncbi:MAG: MBL fold metallo-hydrolase [Planctomycetota bacterium]
MRLTFLGTGTSAGIPMIGCRCEVCTSSDPRDSRLRASALVEWTDATGQDRAVLIDASPDLRYQALRHNRGEGLHRLDAILFTHNHVDHTFGLDEVRRFNAVMRQAIDIYADEHTLEHLFRVYRHIFVPEGNVQRSFVATLQPRELRPAEPIELWGVRFTPIPLLHGTMPILGFRIEPANPAISADWAPLAYCTDTSAVPDAARPMLTGLKTLVLDALRHRPHETHMTLDQALAEAEQIAADRTLFIHMSHDLPHAETERGLPAAVGLSYDGLCLGGPDAF